MKYHLVSALTPGGMCEGGEDILVAHVRMYSIVCVGGRQGLHGFVEAFKGKAIFSQSTMTGFIDLFLFSLLFFKICYVI